MKSSTGLRLIQVVLLIVAVSGCKLGGGGSSNDEKKQNDLTGIGPGSASGKYEIVKNMPFIPRNLVATESKKKTALIYYVADTKEPYFQAAIAHEIRSLREACASRSEHINWVAFVNSHYLARKQYIKCAGGKISMVDMKIDKLDEIVDAIKDPQFDTKLKSAVDSRTALFAPESAVEHPSNLNKHYADNPFVHPEVFHRIMLYAMTEVFPSTDFVYAINTKGHGSENFALTGLTEEQLTEKTKKQSEKIAKLGLSNVMAIKYGEAGLGNNLALSRELQKMGFGQLRKGPDGLAAWQRALASLGAGADGLGGTAEGLGGTAEGLGGTAEGLGGTAEGLGAGADGLGIGGDGLGFSNDGLGANNHFGISNDSYFKVLGLVGRTVSKPGRTHHAEYSIIMMDSCSTDLRRSVLETMRMMPIMRYLGIIYSPAAALNYRSIDWNSWMYDWASKPMSSAEIQQHFYKESPKITNFKPKR